MAKKGFVRSVKNYMRYLDKKKNSSSIMEKLRKEELSHRTTYDNVNNQITPLQIDLQAKNMHLQTLQSNLQQIDADINAQISSIGTLKGKAKQEAVSKLVQLHGDRAKAVSDIANQQSAITGVQNNINSLTPSLNDAQKALNSASNSLTNHMDYINNYQLPSRTVRAIGYTLANPGDVAKGTVKNAATYVGLPYGAYLWGNWNEGAPAQVPNPNTGGAAPTGTGTGAGNPPPLGVPPQGATEPGLPPGQGNVGAVTGATPPPDVQNSGETIPMHRTNAFDDALRAKLARDRIKAYQESKQ